MLFAQIGSVHFGTGEFFVLLNYFLFLLTISAAPARVMPAKAIPALAPVGLFSLSAGLVSPVEGVCSGFFAASVIIFMFLPMIKRHTLPVFS